MVFYDWKIIFNLIFGSVFLNSLNFRVVQRHIVNIISEISFFFKLLVIAVQSAVNLDNNKLRVLLLDNGFYLTFIA